MMIVLNTTVVWRIEEDMYTFPRSVKNQLITRGLVGAAGACFIFEGLKYVSLSENLVLVRTNPIWTAVIAFTILKKDRFSLNLLATLIIGFVGVLLIARPPQITPLLKTLRLIEYEKQAIYGDYFGYGVVMSLMGSICLSLIQAVTSSLIKLANPLAVIQYNALCQLAFGVLMSFIYRP
jgi:drug/metabolite transporter (DMT)-like permease